MNDLLMLHILVPTIILLALSATLLLMVRSAIDDAQARDWVSFFVVLLLIVSDLLLMFFIVYQTVTRMP